MSLEEFGKRIRVLRKNKDHTQKSLGKSLNVGESTVRMWELGKNRPSPETISYMAYLLDADWIELLSLAGYEEVINRIDEERLDEKRAKDLNDFTKEIKEGNVYLHTLEVPLAKTVPGENGLDKLVYIDIDEAIEEYFQIENLLNEISPIYYGGHILNEKDKKMIIELLNKKYGENKRRNNNGQLP